MTAYKTLLFVLCVAWLCGCRPADRDSAVDPAQEPSGEHADVVGPSGGRLLEDGGFALELSIFESGVPPEFHAWAWSEGRAVPPGDVDLAVELTRLGGHVERIGFVPADEFLRGDRTVSEPHSFEVSVIARHAGREHRWSYEAYEGRTTIDADIARASGIATAVAGPGEIVEELLLYGSIVPDVTRVREVRARFPGVIRSAAKEVGDTVRAGETLATVESDESLRTYTVTAPIGGVITARHAAPGEQTGAAALYEVADFSTVWAELNVFARDRARLSPGAAVEVRADADTAAAGTIAYLAPVGDRASQSVLARVVLDNADGRWTPGRFVEADVTVARTPVALAVPLRALQRFREFDVVFAKVGDTYEVRMLTLGRRDARSVEVLDGLAPGTEYVTENSYLVKADIEKSGASHDH